MPKGDFSTLVELPAMYKHCKATEDKDLTVFDFLTDHLINLDGLFDKHENGDEQKPHSPFQFHNSIAQTVLIEHKISISYFMTIAFEKDVPTFSDNFKSSNYLQSVFRPPIV